MATNTAITSRYTCLQDLRKGGLLSGSLSLWAVILVVGLAVGVSFVGTIQSQS